MPVAALALAAGAICLRAEGASATIAATHFTLVWRHSIEKIDWEEDYIAAGGWLYLSGARVRGTGAGMDIPDDAQRVGGVYVYRPAERWYRALDLARSDYVDDYRICIDGRCVPMGRYIPVAAGTTHVTACASGVVPAMVPTRRHAATTG